MRKRVKQVGWLVIVVVGLFWWGDFCVHAQPDEYLPPQDPFYEGPEEPYFHDHPGNEYPPDGPGDPSMPRVLPQTSPENQQRSSHNESEDSAEEEDIYFEETSKEEIKKRGWYWFRGSEQKLKLGK